MGALTFGLVAGGVSGLISGWTASSKQERENKALEARQVLIEQQRKHRRDLFRVQTFSEFYDTMEAGASRINRILSTGFERKGLSNLMDAGVGQFRRNKYMAQYVLKHREATDQFQLSQLESQKKSPWEAAFGEFLATGISTGVQTGLTAYGYKGE